MEGSLAAIDDVDLGRAERVDHGAHAQAPARAVEPAHPRIQAEAELAGQQPRTLRRLVVDEDRQARRGSSLGS